MPSRRTTRVALISAASIALLASACVEPFGGSVINITFDPGVQTPTPASGTPADGRPPTNSFYQFWAIQLEEDQDGNPISFAFHVQDFEVRQLVRLASPCFIEVEQDKYPGLHVTQILERTKFDTGIDNPLLPPADAPEGDVIDVVSAQVRAEVLVRLQNEVRAVVRFSKALPPGHPDLAPDYQIDTGCSNDCGSCDPGMIPAPECSDDENNAARLAMCQQFWAEFPDFYEGSDKVFTLPLNGNWHGSVTGNNPKNAGFLAGASFLPEVNLVDFDILMVNWQYKDQEVSRGDNGEIVIGNDEPDYPMDTPDAQKSNIGFHYMEGTPGYVTRGTINVPLTNRFFNISGEATIFPNLGEDDVHF